MADNDAIADITRKRFSGHLHESGQFGTKVDRHTDAHLGAHTRKTGVASGSG